MPKYFIPLLLVIFFPRNIFSENLGKRIASVPFQLVGNYIVVETRVNDSPPLNLILDTGVRNTIITELDEKDSLQLSYSKTINLQGLGHGKNIEALMSDSNSLRFGKFTLKNRSVCVVKDKLFNLSGQIGTKVNGMKYFEEHLPTNKFVRIHRSYIVNVEAISRIELYEKQNQVITMKNGHHVKASQTGYKNLRKALNL